MAKRKSVKRSKRVVRKVRRTVVKSNKKLNVLLLLLALAVLVLAAVTMSGGGI